MFRVPNLIVVLLFLLDVSKAFTHVVHHNAFLTKAASRYKLGKSVLFSTLTESPAEVEDKVIIITPKAMAHISDLKAKQGLGTLRMGVRSGGCSGMSYVMDFIQDNQITDEDHIEAYGDVKCVVDPKSLLYLYGLQLDYSDELIGGGFKFSNPNAETAWYVGIPF